jgi:type 1 glutamine amidotransferase
MKLIPLIIVSTTLLLMHTSCQDRPDTTSSRILVFSKTEGWRHDSIEPAIEAITTMGRKQNVIVEVSEDAGVFTADNLARFDAVVFLNTSGTIFNDDQRAAFRQYIQNGGGRAFYTGLGHTSESFSDEIFLQHVWGGIQYAIDG